MVLDVESKETKINEINLIPLINLFWKLKTKIQKLDITSQERKPIETYTNTIFDLLAQYGYDIIDYTDRKYNIGDNVEVLSVEGDNGEYYIRECIQPTITQHNQIKQKATVVIKSE